MWYSKPATCYSQGTHYSVSQGRWMPCGETKKKSQYEATEWSWWLESFSESQDISTIFSSHYSNRKAARYHCVVRFKENCPLIELTVPWEENREEALEGKKNRYEKLRADCGEKGWIYHVIPIEDACRGFLRHSSISFLSKIGITGRSLKIASYRLQATVQYVSSWIWSRAKSLQHEWNIRETNIPVWLRNIKKRLLQVHNDINAESKHILKNPKLH